MMRASLLCFLGILIAVAAGMNLPLCPVPVAAQDTVVPQTALSTCAGAHIVSQEAIAAGTGLAVSPDGRWRALYVHTIRGGEVTLWPRDTGDSHLIELDRPTLPAGVTWRILDAVFSPNSKFLAIRSTGAIWVLDVATGEIRYQIGVDPERQAYPGKISLAADSLSVIFWPPESFLADVQSKKDIEVRLYEAATGKLQHTLNLALQSSEAWTEMELSPDTSRIAILRRATRWPGKARLDLFAADSGKLLWETRISAEDFQWSGDGKSLYALGNRLMMIDAATGKEKRHSKDELGPAEHQKLQVSDAVNLAVGRMSLYSRLKRSLGRNDRRETMVVLWRLDSAVSVCQATLPPTLGVTAWLTPQGEIILLEETYELLPQSQLLKSAQIVTYRLSSNETSVGP